MEHARMKELDDQFEDDNENCKCSKQTSWHNQIHKGEACEMCGRIIIYIPPPLNNDEVAYLLIERKLGIHQDFLRNKNKLLKTK